MTTPRFTCDNCGAAVPLQAPSCPTCGKTFDAVRCPRCSHQGPPAAFSDGCPSCGYLRRPQVAPRDAPRATPRRPVFGALMTVGLVLLAVAVAAAWVLRGR